MGEQSPTVIVIAGPNGAGKSTAAPVLLPRTLGVLEFVNADVIARGLSAFQSESVAMQAGRIMLQRLEELAANRMNFAFETTLSSRTFAPWLEKLRASGYSFVLLYLWLPDSEMAITRVLERVRQGGHNVPEDTIRRRYRRGLVNFFTLYQGIADEWHFYDNSVAKRPCLLASGSGTEEEIFFPDVWEQIKKGITDAKRT
jgi:predicted ABC-type ATPase